MSSMGWHLWLLYRWSFLALSIALTDLTVNYQLGNPFLHPRPEDNISNLEAALFDTQSSLMDLVECAGSDPRRDDDSVNFHQNPIFNYNPHMVDPVRLHLFADLAPTVWPTLHHIFHDFHKDQVFGCLSSDLPKSFT